MFTPFPITHSLFHVLPTPRIFLFNLFLFTVPYPAFSCSTISSSRFPVFFPSLAICLWLFLCFPPFPVHLLLCVFSPFHIFIMFFFPLFDHVVFCFPFGASSLLSSSSSSSYHHIIIITTTTTIKIIGNNDDQIIMKTVKLSKILIFGVHWQYPPPSSPDSCRILNESGNTLTLWVRLGHIRYIRYTWLSLPPSLTLVSGWVVCDSENGYNFPYPRLLRGSVVVMSDEILFSQEHLHDHFSFSFKPFFKRPDRGASEVAL